MNHVVVIGDALLDRDIDGTVDRICPDAPVPVVSAGGERARPGGAALAAALLAADGVAVTLITALAGDGAGRELARLLDEAGVAVCDLGLTGETPEKVRVRAGGQSLLRLDRGDGEGAIGPFEPMAAAALARADAVLVADYGRGVTAQSELREALARLPRRIPLVWDPHPRGAEPVAGARLVTPNAGEAAHLAPQIHGDDLAAVAARGRVLAGRWRAGSVAVTLGRRGALLSGSDGAPLVIPAPAVAGGDPCGAGDRFAGAATLALARGAVVSEAVESAVAAASAFVAAGGASAFSAGIDIRSEGSGEGAGSVDLRPGRTEEPAEALVGRIRAGGGTVVATGGCFDLLHAGHVATLEAARQLGDCLVVLVNSDDSVRRLKGPDRPIQPATDRAAVLAALACVDAVAIFDEDTPVEALRRLRPDVFAKGGDYAATDLPEARVLAGWGGQAVIVPYLDGRSTTRLVEEAARRVHS